MQQSDKEKTIREQILEKQKELNQLQKEKRKMIFQIGWSVNKYRQDKRTGPTTIHKRDKYTSYLMKEESKRINGEGDLTN
jgi:tartrate dehydratase beta subunit/fumarate hydratase class I family protein